MSPYFRHGRETPWGGHALRDLFGQAIPDDRTGESLEISAIPGIDSVIENGAFAGRTLRQAAEEWGAALTDDPFPLLVKLLDARETLSVQVHPGDDYALKHEGKRGKTEAWLILAADAGARVAYGLNPGAGDVRTIIERGEWENALRWMDVAPDDVLYLPHGMVHALGGGIVVYEIQQASDVTYRIWDWGRVGTDGKPRELHTKDALAVIRPELLLDKIPGVTTPCAGGSRTAYIQCEYFDLMKLSLAGEMPLESGRMLLLTALGDATIRWSDGAFALAAGRSCVIPAEFDGVSLVGEAEVVCAVAV